MKIGYRRLDGDTSTAYLDCDHNNQHFTCGHGADQPHVGADKYTDEPVAVMWNDTEWTEVAP